MNFRYFVIISQESFIRTSLNPLYPRILVPSLVEIGLVVLEKKMKMWIVYDKDDDDNDDDDKDDGQRKHFDQKTSLEPSAQVC